MEEAPHPKKDYSLASQLISSFDKLDQTLKDKILEAVDRELRLDHQLFNSALKQQVALVSAKA